MQIVVIGGTGFIGSRFISYSLKSMPEVKIVVISRNDNKNVVNKAETEKLSAKKNVKYITADLSTDLDKKTKKVLTKVLEKADVVINLAGAPLVKRWTNKYKGILFKSRIEVTKNIVNILKIVKTKPSLFISGSAIGYYGSGLQDTEYREDSKPGKDFLANLCVAWESEAEKARDYGIRTVILRTGIVLDRDSGALPLMAKPFQFFLGGRIALGKQWLSWIHINDYVRALVHLIKTSDSKGAYNLVSPEPVQNKIFTKKLAAALRRFAIFPVPEFALKLLFGEAASVLTKGQKVLPTALLHSEFFFHYPTLSSALEDIYSS